MNSTLHQWAIDYQVPAVALRALQERLGLIAPTPWLADGRIEHEGKSEGFVVSLVKLRASQAGITVTRNNSGALIPKDSKRLVRFGLFNESEAQNEVVKSPDLFGWRKLLIEPHHVGTYVAQTWGRECKAPDWVYTGSGREVAQLNCINMINAAGGDAAFTTGAGL